MSCRCDSFLGVFSTVLVLTLRAIQNLGIAGVSDGLYVGIMFIIIIVYRLLMWGVLTWRKR